MNSKLPPITQEPIIYVNATPDNGYPLRILKAYRENCNCKWIVDPPSDLYDMMNGMCDKRAIILDKAIKILEKEMA